MSNSSNDTLRKKVLMIFRELAGNRAENLNACQVASGTMDAITTALASEDATEEKILLANEIAFHLSDWNADAAFMVALHLYPKRFSAEEIAEGVSRLLYHVPYHINEAARLGGYPTYGDSPPEE